MGCRENTEMKRIIVVGSPGAGKSWFSQHLGAVTRIEVIHLDHLFWQPGWVEMPRAEWVEVQAQLVKRESWIIDGYYGATLEIRLERADTVMFLDLPRGICIKRALSRVVRNYGRTRSDMANGCGERINGEFLRYIWRFPFDQRPGLLRKLARAQALGVDVMTFKTNREVQTYLDHLQKSRL